MRNKVEKVRLFDDLARMAGGAFQSLGDVKAQIRTLVEGFLSSMDLVTRDEFDRVEALAQKARERQIELEKRLAALEKQMKKPVAKKKAGKKS